MSDHQAAGKPDRAGGLRLLVLGACAVWPLPGLATNGLNLIGFGAESVLMGGADLAVARDTSAINTNPAGLAQTEARAFDNYLAVAYANYGRNPIPEETTSPLLATISEHHVMAGMSRLIGDTYELHAGLEYVFPNSVTYNNPQLPFGPGVQERTEFIAAHVMLSRRW